MNARDDLADLLADHNYDLYSMSYDGRESTTCQCGAPVYPRLSLHQHRANIVLAAGYTKRRTITTAEELDALPVGSVILTSAPRAAAKVAFRNNESEWFTPDASEWFSSDELDDLPVTVSYEPAP